jgi:hypothetical protein
MIGRKMVWEGEKRMTKLDDQKNLGALSSKVYELLDGLEPGERAKVLNAVVQLFGDPIDAQLSGSGAGNSGGSQVGSIGSAPHSVPSSAQQFFVHKQPANKGEMLAIAARYREEHSAADVHYVDDFAKFFVEARQNFDRRNFVRDMKNAQNRAGLFNKGGGRGQYQLSYFGQQYVDALPNREALKNLKRPTPRRKTKKAAD